MPPSVSILMVMKNEHENMRRIFPKIAAQQYEGAVEYVYVDSGSTDGTLEFMREHGVEAHCIPPKDFHHGRTRNLAASLAKHEVLVCLSGDAEPVDEHWLSRLVSPFEEELVGAVYGRQIPPSSMGRLRTRYLESEYPLERQVRDPRNIKQIHPGLFRFSNANAAVRSTLWERFRWNESVLLAEDQGLCREIFNAGYTIIYEPDASVIHGHERNLWQDFKFAVDNGISLTRVGILNNPEIGGSIRYGLSRMQGDVVYFMKQMRPDLALASCVTFFIKFLGVQVGRRDEKLPDWLMRNISEVHEKMKDA